MAKFTMKITILLVAFICVFISVIGQERHYKNQINSTLKEIRFVEKMIVKKPIQFNQQTPKYKQILPNLAWVDTNRLITSPPSYKQHQGRPNN